MSFRKLLLRIMLCSLGLAAVAGVLAVLLGSHELVWRVIGTGITTAVACGLMMLVSRLVDREDCRSAGLLGMTVVLLEFMAALMLIWDASQNLWGVRCSQEIGETMVVFGLAGIFAMLFLKLVHQRGHTAAARTGIVITFVAFVTTAIAIWLPCPYCEDWWQTGGVLGITGALAVMGLIGLGTSPRPWRWVGVGGVAIACAMWLTEIWVGIGSDPGFVVFCVLLSIAAAVAHANLALLCNVTREQRWVFSGTIAAAVFTAGFVDLLIIDEKLFEVGVPQEFLGRLAGAAGIVTGCGSLALCVLTRLNRKVDYEQLSPELSEMIVVCPRCRKKQAVRIGDSSCAGCELRIKIRIEEPRCPRCDYLLYLLTSDRCPECGLEIGAAALGAD